VPKFANRISGNSRLELNAHSDTISLPCLFETVWALPATAAARRFDPLKRYANVSGVVLFVAVATIRQHPI